MGIKINCFISYSHNDIDLKKQFENNIGSFFKEMDINMWTDANLKPGQNWYYRINDKLEESNIIFCLISGNFIKSEPCIDELKRAKNSYRNGTGTIIPVMLNETETDNLDCKEFHFCPVENGRIKPVSQWSSPDDGFRNTCLQVRPVIEDLLKLLKSKDRPSRFREIQNLMASSMFVEALKEMLGFTREFCAENVIAQNKVCRTLGLFSKLEKQLKDNPGDIIEKVMDMLEVMDEVYKDCGCPPVVIN